MAQPPGVLLLALRPFCLWAVQSSDSKVRINPSSSDGQASGKYNQWLLRPSLRSSEDQWTLVRQRHWRRKDLHSRRVRKPVGKTTFRAEARFKAQLLGRCLAKDHRRAHCREPIKCLRCKTNGLLPDYQHLQPQQCQPSQGPKLAWRTTPLVMPPVGRMRASAPSQSLKTWRRIFRGFAAS